MTESHTPSPLPPLLRFVVAFILLSALLNLEYPTGQLFSWQLLRPSFDVWLLLLPPAMVACSGKRGTMLRVGLPLWLLFLALRLFKIGDTAVPMYLNRPFDLSIDSGYLFGLYDLLKTSSLDGDFPVLAAGAVAAGAGFAALSWYGWRAALTALAIDRIRLGFLAGSAVVLGTVLAPGWRPGDGSILARFGEELLAMPRRLERQQAFSTRLERAAAERATRPAALDGLGNADVLLFVVESYGTIVFTRPEYRKEMIATLETFAKVLAHHGFGSVSSSLTSPTYGGSSWLAHATLESGLRVGDDLENAALLRSTLPPMATFFERAGYRTVSVMPGTRFAYPEGAYFGYRQAYYAWHFEYKGPAFGWAPMPDQFVLDWVRRREFEHRRQPLFVRYTLVSSHTAFNNQPPFVVDWDGIGDGSIYNDLEPILYPITWPELDNAGEAYLRSLDYEFTLLADYLARYVSADALIVIIGDHQPNVQLTGPGQPWSVPIHVISRNPRLLEPFARRGYTPGLVPAQPPPHPGMETFLPGLLEDFFSAAPR